MRSDHTPGPWSWLEYPDGRKLLAAARRAVIHCPDAPMAVPPGDRRPIAAAPAPALVWSMVPGEIRGRILDSLYKPDTEWVTEAVDGLGPREDEGEGRGVRREDA